MITNARLGRTRVDSISLLQVSLLSPSQGLSLIGNLEVLILLLHKRRWVHLFTNTPSVTGSLELIDLPFAAALPGRDLSIVCESW